jgi:vacuolar-type H+-ATPase subunit E/Vma4
MAENIVDQILAAARSAGEQLLSEAQERYDADLRKGSAELEREVEERRRRGRRQAEEAVQQELSTVRLEQRRKLHTCKRRLLDEVYEEAWQQVTEEAGYRAWLERQLTAHAQPGDRIVVAARERDRFSSSFKELLGAHGVRLSDEAGRFRAGFVIDRGTTRLNCSLDEEFRALAADAEIEISAALFPVD